MSVRKRKWTTRSGETKEAWIVDYNYEGQRTLKTFQKKKDADGYAQQVGEGRDPYAGKPVDHGGEGGRGLARIGAARQS